jgi:hypothetical protein
MYIARYVCNFTIYFFLVGKLLLVCSVTFLPCRLRACYLWNSFSRGWSDFALFGGGITGNGIL